jgi:hypothetical protein
MSILDIGRSRSGAPETSIHAAAVSGGKADSIRGLVYHFLATHGPATDREIIHYVQRVRPGTRDDSITPRRVELMYYECPAMVTDSGKRQQDPESGLPQVVWRVTTVEEMELELGAVVDSQALQRKRKKIARIEANLRSEYEAYERMLRRWAEGRG